jgi:hypothetical protein
MQHAMQKSKCKIQHDNNARREVNLRVSFSANLLQKWNAGNAPLAMHAFLK